MMIENPSREEIQSILKQSKRIAVVGLSNNPERTSYLVSQAMQKAGYQIIPVNPTIDEVLGEKAVVSLKDIKGEVDIVNIFRRPEYLVDIAQEFLQINCPVFWAQQGIKNEEAFQMLIEAGKTVVMDRCIKVEHALSK
ncbi:CoA-binding protein [Bacillus carboniphilus]|uniref:CoA-binding protein n=1 Tax=Bacillus carboniphilus TaxID=86663 RepID=A0ABY9JZP7_9BACI|nr:CoA-binding protein [Bacillus carboniphilus]WLR44258.1 CoA-binding protein [Bacillus carboniphilus]